MIRAQGAAQNVNKVSSAVHLRFDVRASSLPAEVQDALCALNDHRVSKDGVIVIKSQAFRSQEKNRAEAIERLIAWIARGGARKSRAADAPTAPRSAGACSARCRMARSPARQGGR